MPEQQRIEERIERFLTKDHPELSDAFTRNNNDFLKMELKWLEQGTYMRLQDALEEPKILLSHNGHIDTDLPFEQLVDELGLPRDSIRNHSDFMRECKVVLDESETGKITPEKVFAREYVRKSQHWPLLVTIEGLFDLSPGTFQSTVVDCSYGTSLDRTAQTRITRLLERLVDERRKVFIRTVDVADSQDQTYVINGFDV